MPTTTYLIIGGIAVIFAAYLIFLKSMMNKKNQKLADTFNSTHSDESLTDEQKRLLAFGAILSYYRGEKILGNKPSNNLNEYRDGLKQQWDISNESEAKESLDQLLNLSRSNSFDSILVDESVELNNIQKEIAKGLGIDIQKVKKVKSAYAWDICRAASVAKWCYWAGYITEAEMWSILQQASDVAATKGDDWNNYVISFLLGRTIHGFELDDLIIETKQLFTGKGPSLRKIENINLFTTYKFK